MGKRAIDKRLDKVTERARDKANAIADWLFRYGHRHPRSFTLGLSSWWEAHRIELEIYDLRGRRLTTAHPGDEQTQIDIDRFNLELDKLEEQERANAVH